MTEKASGTSDPDPSIYYTLSAESYAKLCSVRDELLLFATCAERRHARDREMLVCRNTLAHCFEHLAKQVDEVVCLLRDGASAPGNHPLDTRVRTPRN